MVAGFGEVLVGSELAQTLVGSDVIVGVLPLLQGLVKWGNLQVAVVKFVELLGMGALSSLHRAIKLGASGRQNEEVDTALEACCLEFGLELGTAVDLDSSYGKGHTGDHGVEETGCGGGPGLRVDFDHIPAGDRIPGGEVLENHSKEGAHVQGIKLHQSPGFLCGIFPGLAHSVGALQLSPASGYAIERRLFEDSLSLEASKDATHHGCGYLVTLSVQEHYQLILAPPWELLP